MRTQHLLNAVQYLHEGSCPMHAESLLGAAKGVGLRRA